MNTIDKLSPFVQLAQAQAHRKFRLVLPPMPRRPLCLADRARLAAQRAAELAAWEISGGDALRTAPPVSNRGPVPRGPGGESNFE